MPTTPRSPIELQSTAVGSIISNQENGMKQLQVLLLFVAGALSGALVMTF